MRKSIPKLARRWRSSYVAPPAIWRNWQSAWKRRNAEPLLTYSMKPRQARSHYRALERFAEYSDLCSMDQCLAPAPRGGNAARPAVTGRRYNRGGHDILRITIGIGVVLGLLLSATGC